MQKINFQDYPNTTTPINATNLNQLQTNVENSINNLGTVLYSNSNGTTGNVTLNDSTSNYSYLEVYYHKSNCYNSTKIANPNGKVFQAVITNLYQSNAFQNVMARYSISGTTITKQYEGYNSNDTITITTSNEINITKVVGYK